MRVAIINGNLDYRNLFAGFCGFELIDNHRDADVVCFTGGSDVSPILYGDDVHCTTAANWPRDHKEMGIFHECLKDGIAMVGICRGGQFLNVMSGGRMYQDVSAHCGDHHITDLETGDTLLVSSTHHQMMMPSPRGLVVATAALHGRREWYDGEIFRRDVSEQDNEVVYYAHTNSLCFQPHPEFTGKHYTQMKHYFREVLYRHLFKQKVPA